MTRAFFKQRNVLEVETPMLSHYGNTDPNISSFRTDTNTPLYLRTSPEYPLKRLLTAGYGDCYELGRVFRQAEIGQKHNPEFTMLEWYRLGWSWQQLAEEVIELIHTVSERKFNSYETHWISYTKLFEKSTGLNPLNTNREQLKQLLDQHQLGTQSTLEINDALDLVMSLIIQPKLPQSQINVIYNYPATQAALAEINPEDPETALRFEVYLGNTELANGYQELINADELKSRMQADNLQRLATKEPSVPIDMNLLAAQQHGLPACSGVAVGFDRLLMAITGSDNISNCLAFDFSRA